MDAPNLARKTQVEPVPYLGGIAIALGITITTLAAVYVGGNTSGENNDQIKDFEKEYPVLKIALIGSILTKRYRNDADLDINILFDVPKEKQEQDCS